MENLIHVVSFDVAKNLKLIDCMGQSMLIIQYLWRLKVFLCIGWHLRR